MSNDAAFDRGRACGITEVVDSLNANPALFGMQRASTGRQPEALTDERCDQCDSAEAPMSYTYRDGGAWHINKKLCVDCFREQRPDEYHALATPPTALQEGAETPEVARLRRIAWLIGSIYCYGNFKAETVNEDELEKLLRENGTFWESVAEFEAAARSPNQEPPNDQDL